MKGGTLSWDTHTHRSIQLTVRRAAPLQFSSVWWWCIFSVPFYLQSKIYWAHISLMQTHRNGCLVLCQTSETVSLCHAPDSADILRLGDGCLEGSYRHKSWRRTWPLKSTCVQFVTETKDYNIMILVFFPRLVLCAGDSLLASCGLKYFQLSPEVDIAEPSPVMTIWRSRGWFLNTVSPFLSCCFLSLTSFASILLVFFVSCYLPSLSSGFNTSASCHLVLISILSCLSFTFSSSSAHLCSHLRELVVRVSAYIELESKCNFNITFFSLFVELNHCISIYSHCRTNFWVFCYT